MNLADYLVRADRKRMKREDFKAQAQVEADKVRSQREDFQARANFFLQLQREGMSMDGSGAALLMRSALASTQALITHRGPAGLLESKVDDATTNMGGGSQDL